MAERLEREEIEIERQRLEARAKLEQLEHLQAENELQQAVNQVRADVGLDAVAGGSDSDKLSSNMARLLGQLQDLEKQVPYLPDDVKALLADAKGDLHSALQGEEAEKIQENLLKSAEGLVVQVEQYKREIAQLDQEEQWHNHLLAQAENDLQAASRDFLEGLQRSDLLSGEREIIDPLYIETLSKVAYAERAIEVSEDLAKQSKDLLNRILKQRKEERKARKNAFWNELLSTITTILSIVSFFAGPAAVILRTVSGALSAVQAGINGDWAGAIFGAVMAGVGAVAGSLGNAMNAVKETTATVWGMTKAAAGSLLSNIQTIQGLANGLFHGIRAAESGDDVMAFLQVLGAAATVVHRVGLEGLSEQDFAYQLINTLQDVPVVIHSGIQAIEDEHWIAAVSNILNAAVTTAQNFTNLATASDTYKSIADTLKDLQFYGNAGLAVAGAIEKDNFLGWVVITLFLKSINLS